MPSRETIWFVPLLVIGLILGVVVALLREQFDDVVRTKEELEYALARANPAGLGTR